MNSDAADTVESATTLRRPTVELPIIQVHGMQMDGAAAPIAAARQTANLPAPPPVHRFDTELGQHVLIVDGSQVFAISERLARSLDQEISCVNTSQIDNILSEQGIGVAASPAGARITDQPTMLEQMIDCGREFERQVIGGGRYACLLDARPAYFGK